jgi:hypothetical protein
MDKAEVYITKIIEHCGLTRKEIDDMAEEKKEELKGLISTEGALFVLTRELGVDFNEKNTFDKFEAYKINEINSSGMKNLTLNGRISRIFELRTFIKKDGAEGKVLNFTITDGKDSIKIVVWDELTDIIKNPKFKLNALVQITHGYSKWSDYWNKYEVNLGRLSKIIFEPTDVDPKKYGEIEVLGDDW